MCGRASLFVPAADLSRRFDVTVPESYQPRYNVAPHDDLAVVRNDAREELRLHEWGLVPPWADDGHDGFINARAETVEEKPSFQEAAAERRCLVVADGFYEWEQRTTGNQPYRVEREARPEGAPRDGERRGREREDGAPFAMAGLFEPRETGATVTVLTTEPNDVVAGLHDRMAVVLDREEEIAWLDAEDPAERTALLDTPDPEGWHAYPVSSAVNDPAAEGPELVDPVEGADEDPQTGLDDFG
jgi:putative SOS response-associated peptidase YedK